MQTIFVLFSCGDYIFTIYLFIWNLFWCSVGWESHVLRSAPLWNLPLCCVVHALPTCIVTYSIVITDAASVFGLRVSCGLRLRLGSRLETCRTSKGVPCGPGPEGGRRKQEEALRCSRSEGVSQAPALPALEWRGLCRGVHPRGRGPATSHSKDAVVLG